MNAAARERRVLAALLFAAVCAVGIAAWLIARNPGIQIEAGAAAPVERERPSEVAAVLIADGESAAEIGERLAAAGLVSSRRHFQTLATLLGWELVLNGGRYTFEPGLTTYEIIRRIRFGETSPLSITVPEGLRIEEVAELVAASGIATAVEFLEALADPAVAEGTPAAMRPAGAGLEGYLFPSTYTLPLDVSAAGVARMMLERLERELDEALVEAVDAVGLTLHEVLTIASMIEREAAIAEERALISSVIWNRLEQDILLQIDSTVQYARGAAGEYWPEVSARDLGADHPHNTYLNKGLPPTPIANPGRASILAAAEPANTNYLFYAARPDRTHAFAETYAEHQRNIEEIRRGGAGASAE